VRKPYNHKLHHRKQVDAEERIASMIFNDEEVDTYEEVASALGKEILYKILREFRPDLFTE
jgi:hypothetical protein